MKAFLPIVLFLSLAACGSDEPVRYSSHGDPGRNGDVTSYAKSLIGTPYHYGGQSPRTGFDCSGFVRHVYMHTRGIELPRSASNISRVGTRIRGDELQPGDLVFFSTQGYPFSHVGIYIGDAKFIHSPSTGKRVQIVDMSMRYWQAHYNGARRVTNLR